MKLWIYALFLCLLAGNCYALGETEAMRCRSGIVSPGDSKKTVIDKCGEPADKRPVGRRYKFAGKIYPATEQWLYDFGKNEFLYFAIFNGNEVSLLYSTNDYGFK
ncbi:DUF2845 domain-containing protein [Geomobilimonas luticola]|uniref:DUF2845 domain-containing protein n=1 Tax=Geomobilimonas luticola TaxID=1114878 RepID=A0ABS5SIY6_9BACT|nr:DUF2845 domain-containing protein [Geomobilimonas luticola]MBT0654779.1 DUF2845 domain-containing protein [Geomobilimonas luticola]